MGSAEFQPRDVIAPAGYSDLLGYYGSCVRKVRARGVWISLGRVDISVAFKMAHSVSEKDVRQADCRGKLGNAFTVNIVISFAVCEFPCLWSAYFGYHRPFDCF